MARSHHEQKESLEEAILRMRALNNLKNDSMMKATVSCCDYAVWNSWPFLVLIIKELLIERMYKNFIEGC